MKMIIIINLSDEKVFVNPFILFALQRFGSMEYDELLYNMLSDEKLL
jgi:hypothetical protein